MVLAEAEGADRTGGNAIGSQFEKSGTHASPFLNVLFDIQVVEYYPFSTRGKGLAQNGRTGA
jgi:hypothetical protein